MYLFGASGHAKVIVDILSSQGIKVKAFFDEDESKKSLWDIPVIGKTKDFSNDGTDCIISIGVNKTRKKVVEAIEANFGRAIHATSVLGSNVQIGEGTVLMPRTVINADTIIGEHVIINTSASVDHDCEIGDFAHIAPNVGVCGGVSVGEGTLIGAGATVIPLVNIGKWCVIGAGAVITQDVPDYSVVVGNPGKIVKSVEA
ncbi:acetyltransferase [Marivirga atlantica]|jgi:acetyltransferase EpsM|uniref:Acetyltransferase n=1 Tax=Marivirga atlantica TaxID=1548457 RepID=A0A937DHG3_9BACT|nr:acetyltransferase [Marivirga atlantica]MBL0765888.1 acetyltransferase [Marivirga atlantica]